MVCLRLSTVKAGAAVHIYIYLFGVNCCYSWAYQMEQDTVCKQIESSSLVIQVHVSILRERRICKELLLIRKQRTVTSMFTLVSQHEI